MTDQLDFWALKEANYFGDRNDGARWLQEHPEDPYWMAHELTNALFVDRPYDQDDFSRLFTENWKLAREIHGIEN